MNFRNRISRQNENPGTTIEEEANTVNTPAEGLTETSAPTKTTNANKTTDPHTDSRQQFYLQRRFKNQFVNQFKSQQQAHQGKRKTQNPALSYYRTEPTGTPDRKTEKEQKPVIRMQKQTVTGSG